MTIFQLAWLAQLLTSTASVSQGLGSNPVLKPEFSCSSSEQYKLTSACLEVIGLLSNFWSFNFYHFPGIALGFSLAYLVSMK